VSRRDVPPESGPRLTLAAKGARTRLIVIRSVRLNPLEIARIDAIAASRSTKWKKVSRSEVLRELVEQGLGEVERSAPRARHLRLVKGKVDGE
jgi:hypothetical protein